SVLRGAAVWRCSSVVLLAGVVVARGSASDGVRRSGVFGDGFLLVFGGGPFGGGDELGVARWGVGEFGGGSVGQDLAPLPVGDLVGAFRGGPPAGDHHHRG